MAKVRIGDVAREAGVSLGTVSNALNHPEKVRPETRKLIQEAIDRLGYTPNQSARLLAGGRNTAIGLVLPRLNHGTNLQVANGAHAEALRLGYDLLIATSSSDRDLERHYLNYFMSTQVAGVLVQPTDTPGWKPFPAVAAPTVYIGIHSDEPGLYVTADHRGQGRLIASHLVAKGADHIAIIGHASNQIMHLRLEGALEVAGDHPDIRFEVLDAGEGNVSGDGYSLGQQIARRPGDDRPEAVLALTDVLGAGAVAGITAAGLSIPDDIMVAGCGGNPLAWSGAISLTTSAPTGYEVGRKGVRLLVEAIDEQRAEERVQTVRVRGGAAAGQSRRTAVLEENAPREPLTHWELVKPFLLVRESTGGPSALSVPGNLTHVIPELNLGVYL